VSSRLGSHLPSPSRNRTSSFPAYGSSFGLRGSASPLPASDQFPLLLIPCMMIMFLPSRSTSCGMLRSSGITPNHRYLYPHPIPALASSEASPSTLTLHTSLSHLWHRCFREELPFPATRLVAPSSVRSARCSLRPRVTVVALVLTCSHLLSAPVLNGSTSLHLFILFRGYVSDSERLSLHLAELAVVQSDC